MIVLNLHSMLCDKYTKTLHPKHPNEQRENDAYKPFKRIIIADESYHFDSLCCVLLATAPPALNIFPPTFHPFHFIAPKPLMVDVFRLLDRRNRFVKWTHWSQLNDDSDYDDGMWIVNNMYFELQPHSMNTLTYILFMGEEKRENIYIYNATATTTHERPTASTQKHRQAHPL